MDAELGCRSSHPCWLSLPIPLYPNLPRGQVAAQLDPETDAELGLPDMVGGYHSIYPLEDSAAAAEHVSPALGVSTLLLKGILTADGVPYALRRVDPRQVTPHVQPPSGKL